jgi:hypothetical protein
VLQVMKSGEKVLAATPVKPAIVERADARPSVAAAAGSATLPPPRRVVWRALPKRPGGGPGPLVSFPSRTGAAADEPAPPDTPASAVAPLPGAAGSGSGSAGAPPRGRPGGRGTDGDPLFAWPEPATPVGAGAPAPNTLFFAPSMEIGTVDAPARRVALGPADVPARTVALGPADVPAPSVMPAGPLSPPAARVAHAPVDVYVAILPWLEFVDDVLRWGKLSVSSFKEIYARLPNDIACVVETGEPSRWILPDEERRRPDHGGRYWAVPLGTRAPFPRQSRALLCPL